MAGTPQQQQRQRRRQAEESWFEGSLLEACMNTCGGGGGGGGVLAGSRRGRGSNTSRRPVDAEEEFLATPSKVARTNAQEQPLSPSQQVQERRQDDSEDEWKENAALWRAKFESSRLEFGNLLTAIDRYCRDNDDAAPLAEIFRRHDRVLMMKSSTKGKSANNHQDQQPALKELREKLNAMTAERNDALRRLEQTEAALRRQQQEGGRSSSSSSNGSKAKNDSELQQRLSLAHRERDEAIRSRNEAVQRREEAVRERQRLFAMLQRTTTKRTDPPGNFPNGDQIQQRLRQCQVEATDLFHNLADCLLRDQVPLEAALLKKFHQDKSLTAYSIVLDSILYPLYRRAQLNVQTILGRKEDELRRFLGKEDGGRRQDPAFTRELLGNDHESRHSLLHLFWTSSMQEVLAAFLKSSDTAAKKKQKEEKSSKTVSVMSLVMDAEEEATPPPREESPSNRYLLWASKDSVQHELVHELEGKSIHDLVESLTLLLLLCHFSDPRCFLWPPVAAEVPVFSPDDSKAEHVAGTKRLQRAGDTGGRVLYPGLYFQDPITAPNTEPCCKSIVVSLLPAATKGGGGGGGDKEKSKRRL